MLQRNSLSFGIDVDCCGRPAWLLMVDEKDHQMIIILAPRLICEVSVWMALSDFIDPFCKAWFDYKKKQLGYCR